ncbi:hypothetical protein Xmau_03375 [Xenorhabdus mauleonii]|uniref:Uncharacterized protein n=1 Tax=Xenorhabdus mauleonii TaxID=351675 RepID=A0A1I3R1F2_9GAMM|nr:hypothetical protein [Xenorhabdus mauleonii]PHM38667.1 hypothetical protein Xmau_03375 [Xenorhabdus mauleonii]SFJ39197.1 hypothetical protein SAMN05421680_10884 [Xenorhabdus mauleonii]
MHEHLIYNTYYQVINPSVSEVSNWTAYADAETYRSIRIKWDTERGIALHVPLPNDKIMLNLGFICVNRENTNPRLPQLTYDGYPNNKHRIYELVRHDFVDIHLDVYQTHILPKLIGKYGLGNTKEFHEVVYNYCKSDYIPCDENLFKDLIENPLIENPIENQTFNRNNILRRTNRIFSPSLRPTENNSDNPTGFHDTIGNYSNTMNVIAHNNPNDAPESSGQFNRTNRTIRGRQGITGSYPTYDGGRVLRSPLESSRLKRNNGQK